MPSEHENKTGKIGWIDLTVPNAEAIGDFYRNVAGWSIEPVAMGAYDDYNMIAADGQPAAGICHKSGPNENLPSHWLIYINVEDLDRSIAECLKLSGKILAGPTSMGNYGRFCVIEDPAGAVAALFEPAEK